MTHKHLEIDSCDRDLLHCEPFSVGHDLAGDPLFDLQSLVDLAKVVRPGDYFISTSAPSEDSEFYGGPAPSDLQPVDVMRQLPNCPYKILLKRPEKYVRGFRDLLEELLLEFRDVSCHRAGDVLRAESSIFVTGYHAITPCHFDPETSFLLQVHGDKIYHVFSPSMVSDTERERHYSRGYVDVGRVSLPPKSKTRGLELHLKPGLGLHQPLEAPHWAETRDSLSVSYAFGFETRQSRSRGRVYAFNNLMRKLGMRPRPQGTNRFRDWTKSQGMVACAPLLRAWRGLRRS